MSLSLKQHCFWEFFLTLGGILFIILLLALFEQFLKKIPIHQVNQECLHYNFTQCFLDSLKGIVHPKMKILSSFTHHQVVPNLYECLCSAEHKGRYSEECGKQSSSGAPLTSIVFFFSYYGSQWCPKTAWLQTFFKISSFVFGRTKTFIQVHSFGQSCGLCTSASVQNRLKRKRAWNKHYLKGWFTQKLKFCHHLLTLK